MQVSPHTEHGEHTCPPAGLTEDISMQTPQDFYGKHYASAADKAKLDEAHKWLVKAITFEDEATAKGETPGSKVEMAFKQACKREAEGFGIAA
jgi:hypothetical protein